MWLFFLKNADGRIALIIPEITVFKDEIVLSSGITHIEQERKSQSE